MDVVGIGIPCVDFLACIKELPEENQSTRLLEYSWQGGGKIPTALVTTARLGGTAGMVAVVGDCPSGMFCVEDFHRHGVDTSRMVIDTGKETSFSLVLADQKTSGRNIIYHPGSVRDLTLDDLDREYITAAEYLHLSEATPITRQAALWARAAGVKVVFDADNHSRAVEEMIPLVDVFIASEFYYDEVFSGQSYEESCRRQASRGPNIVVFTLGEKGCVGLEKGRFFNVPGFKVDAKDTTGAGDVFHGAFIYGLLQGWGAVEVAKFANAVAAIKCTRIGGRAGIPDLETVTAFLRTGTIDYADIDQRVEYYRKPIV